MPWFTATRPISLSRPSRAIRPSVVSGVSHSASTIALPPCWPSRQARDTIRERFRSPGRFWHSTVSRHGRGSSGALTHRSQPPIGLIPAALHAL
jgi:hypothetical protein